MLPSSREHKGNIRMPMAPCSWTPERTAEIVRLWNAGLDAPTIAGRMGLSRLAIESRLARLRRQGAMLEPRRRRRAKPGPARAMRRCLFCAEDFASEHAGNRLCPACLVDGPYTSALV
jgi:hypothetical protein